MVWMSPDGAPRKKEADSENDGEPDQQPHGHLGERWLAGSLAERHDTHQTLRRGVD
jgi:hypothetical protein